MKKTLIIILSIIILGSCVKSNEESSLFLKKKTCSSINIESDIKNKWWDDYTIHEVFYNQSQDTCIAHWYTETTYFLYDMLEKRTINTSPINCIDTDNNDFCTKKLDDFLLKVEKLKK